MFELLLLVSVALITVGQLLPKEVSEHEEQSPAQISPQKNKAKKMVRSTTHLHKKQALNAKQPSRKFSARAAIQPDYLAIIERSSAVQLQRSKQSWVE